MKLKEKFENIKKEHQKEKDDFAIGFVGYLDGIFDAGLTIKEIKELLEIYKKTL